MNFRLSKGPWKTIFEGTFQDHDMEIMENPDSLLMVAIYETTGGEKTGVLLECFRAFHAQGPIEALLEKTTIPGIVVLKHDGKKNISFFLLGGSPGYAHYDADEIHAETDTIMAAVANNTRLVKGMALSTEVRLVPLHEADSHIQQAFLSQPLALAALYGVPTGGMAGKGKSGGIEEITITSTPSAGTVVLGIDKARQVVREPVAFFERTLVEGGKNTDRLHAMRVIMESALLSKANVIVFDHKNEFGGLSSPTTNVKKLKEFGVPFDPVGFPLKSFTIPEMVHVNLAMTSAQNLAELYGFGQTTERAVESLLSDAQGNTLMEKAQAADSLKRGEGDSAFEQKRAIRIMRTLALHYPGLFAGQNNLPELLEGGVGGLGRCALIECKMHDKESLLLLAHGMLREIFEHAKKRGKQKALRAIVVFPYTEILFPLYSDSTLMRETIEVLYKLKDYGIGFLLGADRGTSINENLKKLPDATISIINGNDVGIQLTGKRAFRVKIRPTLSSG